MTKTPSDAAMIEALARKMGWHRAVMADWWITHYAQGEGPATVLFADWNPLESHDPVHDVEKQLANTERDAYIREMLGMNDPMSQPGKFDLFNLRHADARTCATSLCRVIEPELFEGGGE